jgi:putative tryptophan/tyrosine transport system substrate-binding protein
MKRRDFITLLGGAAAAWPAAVHAQHAGMPIVGVLGSGSPVYAERLTLIRQGLEALGFAESLTVTIESARK